MEYVIIGNDYTEVSSFVTKPSELVFTVNNGNAMYLKDKFIEVSELKVSGEDKLVYGNYDGLVFESSSVDKDGNVTITMHIMSEIERRLHAIESSQRDQDEAIISLAETVYTVDITEEEEEIPVKSEEEVISTPAEDTTPNGIPVEDVPIEDETIVDEIPATEETTDGEV